VNLPPLRFVSFDIWAQGLGQTRGLLFSHISTCSPRYIANGKKLRTSCFTTYLYLLLASPDLVEWLYLLHHYHSQLERPETE